MEGKSNAAGIRFRPVEGGRIEWNGTFANLVLPLIVDPNDPVQAHALAIANAISCRTTKDGNVVKESGVKYVRLLSRTIRGEERVFAQLVLRGVPFQKAKHTVQRRRGGLDLGPSHVAVVTEGEAKSFDFCAGLDRKEKALRVYRRRSDRQRRANNQENYQEDGTIKPRNERKRWVESHRQKSTKVELAEVQRAMAAERESLQGAMVHVVLSMANDLSSEKVSKKAWQKLWGRSVGHKAPGRFESRTGLLAKASGGSLELVSTWKTYLSSRCLCGKRKKKPQSERKHECGCEFIPNGMHADRDEFSAFLAMHCQGDLLDEGKAREAWLSWGADCLLRSSSSDVCGSRASGESSSTTHKPREARQRRARPKEMRGQSGSLANRSGQRRKSVPINIGRRRALGTSPIGLQLPKTSQPGVKNGGPHAA